MKNGRPYGKGKAFYPNGAVKLEGTFGIKGLLEGKIYRPDGTLRFEGSFDVNRNYGPNKPVEGTLYDENGKEIYRGGIHYTCGGVGYPIITEPAGFRTEEYHMPVRPYLWQDEKEKAPEEEPPEPESAEVPTYDEFFARVKSAYMTCTAGLPEEHRLAYLSSAEAVHAIRSEYESCRKKMLAGKLTRRQFLEGGTGTVGYCLSLMYE